MLRIAICDDDDNVVKTVRRYLDNLALAYPHEFHIASFTSADDFIDSVNAHTIYDIIYLDIEIGGVNGIDVGRQIRKNLPEALIMVISSHSKYYKAAFSIQPFNFMDKPLVEKEFSKLFEEMYSRLVSSDNLFFYQKNRVEKRVPIRDIICFMSDKRMITIHTLHEQDSYYGKLSEIERSLKRKGFLLLHQSFLVNYNHIEELRYDDVTLTNGLVVTIPLSKRSAVRRECLALKRRYVDYANQ